MATLWHIKDRDASRLRADIEAYAACGAACAIVVCRVIAMNIEVAAQRKHLYGTSSHAQGTPFTDLLCDDDKAMACDDVFNCAFHSL